MLGLIHPDPENTNNERAAVAGRTLRYFARNFGVTDDRGRLAGLAEGNLVTLLTDLAHYCDRENLNFHDCVLRAGRFYLEETENLGLQFGSLPCRRRSYRLAFKLE